MSNYAVFFDYKGTTYRLPCNPEEIKKTSVQANEKYVVFGLGQIAIPTNMELAEYSFTVEFPYSERGYTETNGQFKNFDFYDHLFTTWRQNRDVVRFIAHNGITKDTNTLCLIENFDPTEAAGEEGDITVDFKLLQYIDFGVKSVVITTSSSGKPTTKAKKPAATKNPKAKKKYTVKKGDTLFSIAKKMYGNGAKSSVIFNANKKILKHPNLIKAGMVLTIP